MFNVSETDLPGLLMIKPRALEDSRGSFIKTFNKSGFSEAGLEVDFREQYYSISKKGVIRGMHFQTPPEDHVKVVYCLSGTIFDVVLDLRVGSPTYGDTRTFELNDGDGAMLYIPKGFAHGFCATSDSATMMYHVTTEYSPKHDDGVLWSSVPVTWPTDLPIVSERDAGFQAFAEISSPFRYV